MKYRNNLTDRFENARFVVVNPFTAFIRLGSIPSNSYYGASRIYASVYGEVTLPRGTVIEDLCGGVFAILNGVHYPLTAKVSEKGFFEKTYGTPIEKFPVENIQEVPYGAASSYKRPPDKVYTNEEVAALGGRRPGFSEHVVVPYTLEQPVKRPARRRKRQSPV